jgi:hypothetical protein
MISAPTPGSARFGVIALGSDFAPYCVTVRGFTRSLSLKRLGRQNHLGSSEIAASLAPATFVRSGLTTHRDLLSV